MISAGIAGCLGEVSSDASTEPTSNEWESGECDAPYVEYDELPAEIATEVDVAFEDGSYETDGSLLYDAAISADTPLWKDGTPYRHRIEQGDETVQLVFEELTSYSSPEDLELRNTTDDSVEVAVTVTDETDETVLETDEITVEPDDPHVLAVTGEFGTYNVEVTVGDGRRETDTWRITPSKTGREQRLIVTIATNEISFGGGTPQMSLDYEPCSVQWDDR